MEESPEGKEEILKGIFKPLEQRINDLISKKYFDKFKEEVLWNTNHTDIVDEIWLSNAPGSAKDSFSNPINEQNIFSEILAESEGRSKISKSTYEGSLVTYSSMRKAKSNKFDKRYSAQLEWMRLLS